MLFDVPYIPETDYTEFLLNRQEHIFSLHFSLFQEGIADGRHKAAAYSGQLLRGKLALFQGTKKYALLNARFYRPETYLHKEKINLDRSLNRDLDALETVGRKCRAAYPGIQITLLANEGCLPLCRLLILRRLPAADRPEPAVLAGR